MSGTGANALCADISFRWKDLSEKTGVRAPTPTHHSIDSSCSNMTDAISSKNDQTLTNQSVTRGCDRENVQRFETLDHLDRL
jgi:hypothetical protein